MRTKEWRNVSEDRENIWKTVIISAVLVIVVLAAVIFGYSYYKEKTKIEVTGVKEVSLTYEMK